MCISPNMLPDGTLIGCRNCWQCRERRVLDWSGRCIAESKVATASSFVTLTYGGELDVEGNPTGDADHERVAILTYSDVQNFFKRLRKAGFACSYFVTGEYGSLKGRAHWHLIIYWHGAVPAHEIRKHRYSFSFWPHGFTYWDKVTPDTVRYVCKYVLKDLDDAEAQGLLSMSKKPPLGARYFEQRAALYVQAGLAPQNLDYGFEEARNKNGKKLKFQLSGRSAEMFLESYIRQWRGYPPRGFEGPPAPVRGWHYPPSEVVEKYEDAQTRRLPLSEKEISDLIIYERDQRRVTWQKIEAARTETQANKNAEERRISAYLNRIGNAFEG